MTLGYVVNLSLLMPFYMIILFGLTKPVMTIILLGPPALAFIKSLYLNLREQDSAENKEFNTSKAAVSRFSKDMFPTLFLIMACIVFVSDVRHVYQALTHVGVPWTDALGESLSALSTSVNFVTLLNVIGLLGLYGKNKGEIEGMLGLHSDNNPIIRWATEWEPSSLSGQILQWVAVIACMLVFFCTGISSGPICEDSLQQMESWMQRAFIRSVYYVYKPLLHVLLTVAFVGVLCYFWLFGTLTFVLVILIKFVVLPFILPRAIRARALLGASTEEINAALDDIESREIVWSSYMFLPSMFAILLPLAMPLTLRLLGGDGYFGALAATWNDRHAAAYFGHLWSGVQSAWSKVFVWTVVLSASL